MLETFENCLGLVKNSIYFARQAHELYQVMPYLVDLKLPVSFKIHWVRRYLVDVVLFGIKVLKL